jgi:hypothetical protein
MNEDHGATAADFDYMAYARGSENKIILGRILNLRLVECTMITRIRATRGLRSSTMSDIG